LSDPYTILRALDARPPKSLLGLLTNPAADFRVQHVERKRTVPQHFIVENADVKLVAEFPPRFVSQFQDLQLSQLISQRLAWPRDVAVDLALDVRFIHRGVAMEVGHHLVAGPMFFMHAGVD